MTCWPAHSPPEGTQWNQAPESGEEVLSLGPNLQTIPLSGMSHKQRDQDHLNLLVQCTFSGAESG